MLITSRQDARANPARKLVELYGQRREIELGFSKIKQSVLVGAQVLRSKQHKLVRQELWGVLIAYSLLRCWMREMADPLQISAELYKKVEKAFGPQLSMWDSVGSKLIVLATYWIDQVGMAMVSEITLVNTNANYLPFETNFEKKLLDELMLKKRRFTKCLRFNLKVSIPIASVVLTDTDTPVAMFIQLPDIDLETFDAKIDEVASLGMKTWVWRAGQARMPDLPPVGSRPGVPQ